MAERAHQLGRALVQCADRNRSTPAVRRYAPTYTQPPRCLTNASARSLRHRRVERRRGELR